MEWRSDAQFGWYRGAQLPSHGGRGHFYFDTKREAFYGMDRVKRASESFLSFFEGKGHVRSERPADSKEDTSLLLINSGMAR
jgi:hypothetical protein